jgi:predicted transcriptional regulator
MVRTVCQILPSLAAIASTTTSTGLAHGEAIADCLCVTEGTVRNYVSSVLAHLGLRNRMEAALYANGVRRTAP